MKHVQSNIQGECPGAETSRELYICRSRIIYVKEALNIDPKAINDHKIPVIVTTIILKIMMKNNYI